MKKSNSMRLVTLLHIYQPPDWDPKIINKVVRESYRPILSILKKQKGAKVTLNINGSLTEQLFRLKHKDVLKSIAQLAKAGQLEFTGSAKYHVILPKLPPAEISRQIKLNQETNRKYFGKLYQPKGFFSPELCYSKKVTEVVAQKGFKWIALDEIALNGKLEAVDWQRGYQLKNSKLKIVFRNRLVGDYFLAKSQTGVKKEFRKLVQRGNPVVIAMDGETLGHHRPGMEKTFAALLKNSRIKSSTYSEYLKGTKNFKNIIPRASSWASSEQELKKNIAYELWDHPKNAIHQTQWQLFDLVIKTVQQSKNDSAFSKARLFLDQALNSDPFWWASCHPWWSVEIIETGARRLVKTLTLLKAVPKAKLKKAQVLSKKISASAHYWQQSGKAAREKKMFLAGYKSKPYMAGKKVT